MAKKNLSEKEKNSIRAIFWNSLNPSQQIKDYGFLEELAENYKASSNCEMIYDAIIKACEILKDDNPFAINIFIEALDAHSEHINRNALINSWARYSEHIRLNVLKKNVESELIYKGFLGKSQTLDIAKVDENIEFASAHKSLSHTWKDFDEIKVSVRTVDALRVIELESLSQLQAFDNWRHSDEFKKFAQAYYRCCYAVKRSEIELARQSRRLVNAA